MLASARLRTPSTINHLMLQDVNILLFRLIQINKPTAIQVSFLTQVKYH